MSIQYQQRRPQTSNGEDLHPSSEFIYPENRLFARRSPLLVRLSSADRWFISGYVTRTMSIQLLRSLQRRACSGEVEIHENGDKHQTESNRTHGSLHPVVQAGQLVQRAADQEREQSHLGPLPRRPDFLRGLHL